MWSICKRKGTVAKKIEYFVQALSRQKKCEKGGLGALFTFHNPPAADCFFMKMKKQIGSVAFCNTPFAVSAAA